MKFTSLSFVCFTFAAIISVHAKPCNKAQPRWKANGQVVFLGDSITDWFDSEGIDTWNTYYAPLGAVNTGVSGDQTTTVIDRINNQGIINGLNAYQAVLKIGTNDLSGGTDEATIVNNIVTIINLVKEKNPGVRVILLGILPRGGADIHQRARNVNAMLARLANDSDIFFLDMDEQFSNGLGVVKPELFWDDQLHLSPQGYVIWAQTMNPLFDRVLNTPFDAKAVWLGDSLTDFWDREGTPVWNEHYVPVRSLNVGIAGHTSVDTLRRIEQEGVLEGINPKVAVLMIGGNDLQNGAQAPSVVANIEKIIQYLREKLPHTRIILLGLLPAGGVPEVVVEQGRLINDALVQMHNGDDLHYMDMRAQFGDENEQIYQDLYLVDGIHLTLKGYQVWHETMGPLFRQLLEFK